jgi:hypothetical protein
MTCFYYTTVTLYAINKKSMRVKNAYAFGSSWLLKSYMLSILFVLLM